MTLQALFNFCILLRLYEQLLIIFQIFRFVDTEEGRRVMAKINLGANGKYIYIFK